MRLFESGSEDTTFNANLGTGFNSSVNAIAYQPSDGKILVGGAFTTFNGATRNILMRLNPDGTEDTAFTTALGSTFQTLFPSGYGALRSIVVQPDGKILIGGRFTYYDGTSNHDCILRLNSNGTSDTTFNTNIGSGMNAGSIMFVTQMIVQSDGKILVCGDFTTFKGLTRNYLIRLNSDGTEDTAFYTNLGTSFELVPNSVNTIGLQGDGKIVVGGAFSTFKGVARNRLVRLNSDGTEDTAFYTNLGSGFNAAVNAIGVQSDGRLLVGGLFTTLNATTRNYIVRLTHEGVVDANYYTNMGTAFNGGINSIVLFLGNPEFSFIAGAFTSFNGTTRNRIVGFIPSPARYAQGVYNAVDSPNFYGGGASVVAAGPGGGGDDVGGAAQSFTQMTAVAGSNGSGGAGSMGGNTGAGSNGYLSVTWVE